MVEYILPVKYQNIGYGISVVIAGLETTCQNYKKIEISIDDIDYIETTINTNNIDFTNIVTFNNLEKDIFYIIYAKLTTTYNEVITFDCKILPQLQTATVELSPEMKKQNYCGGALSNFDLPKVVI